MSKRIYEMNNAGTGPKGHMQALVAKKTIKPVNFIFLAPEAKAVSWIGDFNDWHPNSIPMKRHLDGSWHCSVELKQGHHKYAYFVDGKMVLDPKGLGIARNAQNERVSLVAVS